jgi:hypothetical protein
LAVDGDTIYLLGCLPVESEIDPPTTRCRVFALDRSRDKVEADTVYRGSMTGDRSRFSTWRFTLDGEVLELDTVLHSDGERDEDEEFAQALAVALGWKLSEFSVAAW